MRRRNKDLKSGVLVNRCDVLTLESILLILDILRQIFCNSKILKFYLKFSLFKNLSASAWKAWDYYFKTRYSISNYVSPIDIQIAINC